MFKRAPHQIPPTVYLPPKVERRLASLRHRLDRSSPRGFSVREFYR